MGAGLNILLLKAIEVRAEGFNIQHLGWTTNIQLIPDAHSNRVHWSSLVAPLKPTSCGKNPYLALTLDSFPDTSDGDSQHAPHQRAPPWSLARMMERGRAVSKRQLERGPSTQLYSGDFLSHEPHIWCQHQYYGHGHRPGCTCTRGRF